MRHATRYTFPVTSRLTHAHTEYLRRVKFANGVRLPVRGSDSRAVADALLEAGLVRLVGRTLLAT
jgi:hypothetical protein